MKRVRWVAVAATVLLLIPLAAGAEPLLLGGVGFGSPANRGALVEVNQTTGAGVLVGPGAGPNAGLTGLTVVGARLVYGSAISNNILVPGAGAPTLLRLDLDTGMVVESVPISVGDAPLEVNDLAAMGGVLYATSLSTSTFVSSIYTLDPSSGAATLVGPTGVIGVAIAFAPGGTLYMTSATFGAGGQEGSFLHTVNPSTGAVITTTAIAPLPSGNLLHVGGLAVDPSDGTLYAAGREATVDRRGDIYTLTPTGLATFVGSTGVGEVGDLAFAEVPEPATIALLGAAVLAFRVRRRDGRDHST